MNQGPGTTGECLGHRGGSVGIMGVRGSAFKDVYLEVFEMRSQLTCEFAIQVRSFQFLQPREAWE